MANAKITELTALTAVANVDLLPIVDDPSGTPLTKKITRKDFLAEAGKKHVQITCFDYTTDVATGDGKGYLRIDETLNGMNLVDAWARVITAGTTGTMDIQIANVTDAVDMLSTKITIDSTETDSKDGATQRVINTTYDDVATGDLLRIDVDAVQTTKAKGLIVGLTFQLP